MEQEPHIAQPEGYSVLGRVITTGLRHAQLVQGGQGLLLHFALRDKADAAMELAMFLPDAERMLRALEDLLQVLRGRIPKSPESHQLPPPGTVQ